MSTTAELLAAADALADICEQSPCGACPPDDPCGQCCEDAAVARYRALRAVPVAAKTAYQFSDRQPVYIKATLNHVFQYDNTASHDTPIFVPLDHIVPAAEIDGLRAERDALRARLEISGDHDIDGIEARDTTIFHIKREWDECVAENARLREELANHYPRANGDWLAAACRQILAALKSTGEDEIEQRRRLVGNPAHPSAESPPPEQTAAHP